jgi:hypothetical protein
VGSALTSNERIPSLVDCSNEAAPKVHVILQHQGVPDVPLRDLLPNADV